MGDKPPDLKAAAENLARHVFALLTANDNTKLVEASTNYEVGLQQIERDYGPIPIKLPTTVARKRPPPPVQTARQQPNKRTTPSKRKNGLWKEPSISSPRTLALLETMDRELNGYNNPQSPSFALNKLALNSPSPPMSQNNDQQQQRRQPGQFQEPEPRDPLEFRPAQQQQQIADDALFRWTSNVSTASTAADLHKNRLLAAHQHDSSGGEGSGNADVQPMRQDADHETTPDNNMNSGEDEGPIQRDMTPNGKSKSSSQEPGK